MTITTTNVFERYDGDGNTIVFPIGFKWTDDSHIKATLRDTNNVEVPWTQGTQYTLSGVGNQNGGNLTVIVDPINYTPLNGEVLLIELEVPNTQGVALPLGGEFPSPEVEKALDLLTQQVGQLIRDFQRSFRVPTTDSQIGDDTLYPIDTERANKFLAFDANGKPIAAVTVDQTAVVSTFWENILGLTTVLQSQQALDLEVGVDVQAFNANNAVLNLAQEYTKAQNFNAGTIASTLRPENVTNGDFATDSDWVKGAGWTIAAGVADVDGTQVADSDLEQTLSPTLANGLSYFVEFDVLNYTAGNLTPILGGTAGTTVSANGSYSEYILAGSTDEKIIFRADLDGDMQIDNVSIREVDLDWDLEDNQVATVVLDRPDIILDTPFNPQEGGTYILVVKQDGTGGRTLGFSNNYKWPEGVTPFLPTTPNAKSILSFLYEGGVMNGVAQTNFS